MSPSEAPAKPKRPRLPPGYRALLSHLVAGGLIQQDESGLAWVSATRSNGWFTNEAVARVQERGFSHQDDEGKRHRYALVQSTHRGKLAAIIDTTPPPKRERKAKAREAHRPRRPRRGAHERTERLT